LKFIFSTDSIKRGGKERQLFILACRLQQLDYDVHILSLGDASNNYISEYNISRDKIHIIAKLSKIERFNIFKDYLKKIKPDVVFSWDMQTSFFSLLLYKKLNFKFINGSIQHGIRLFKVSQLLRSLICWFSPYIIANSLAGLKANNTKQGKKRFVLYNGIENKFFNILNTEENEIEKHKFITGYKNLPGPVFVSVANFVPYKDYSTVLKSLYELKKAVPFYYIILGDGPMRKEIINELEVLKLSDNVIIKGKVNNVQDYLKISDYMIHSSRGEGVSNAILEGMFTGLPIIATNVGGIPETVWPGSSALFEYKNDKQLLDILLNLDKHFGHFDKNDPDYQAHLKKFSVDTMIKNFEEIIEKVMND
jgi:glycosyltransferase involved in cell wall biosynthesis